MACRTWHVRMKSLAPGRGPAAQHSLDPPSVCCQSQTACSAGCLLGAVGPPPAAAAGPATLPGTLGPLADQVLPLLLLLRQVLLRALRQRRRRCCCPCTCLLLLPGVAP
jgi:hypothetical protein